MMNVVSDVEREPAQYVWLCGCAAANFTASVRLDFKHFKIHLGVALFHFVQGRETFGGLSRGYRNEKLIIFASMIVFLYLICGFR